MGASIDSLIPDLRPYARQLLSVAGQAGLQPRITSTLRTHAEQTRLYRNFQQGRSAYPVAPPGTSAHEYGYAFDMMIMSADMNSDLADLGSVWQSWGGIWGGQFNDPIHFEYPGFSVPKDAQPSILADAVKSAVDAIYPFGGILGYDPLLERALRELGVLR